MDTESWTLPLKWVFSLKELIIVIQKLYNYQIRQEVWKNKQARLGIIVEIILHKMAFYHSISWHFIGYFKLTLKSDWLFCFTVSFSLTKKKKSDLEQKYCDSWINRTSES